MFTKIRNRVERDEGFTLIELLVVILIIGILAAIAIPSFLNQRQKGQDTCAKSMARTAQTAMETYYVDNNSYTGAGPTNLAGIESQVTGTACGTGQVVTTGVATATGAACTGGAPGADNYCVEATSAAGGAPGRPFVIERTALGAISRWCGTGAGGGAAGTATGNGGACAQGTW